MFVLCCLEDLGYKCSVEHNAGLFRIELLFYLYTACFGPFSGHHQACQYILCEIFVWSAKGPRHVACV